MNEINKFNFKKDYSINDVNIEKVRDITILSNENRFRILLEIAKGCYGSCSGCSLSVLDRKDLVPAISIERVKEIFDYFIPIIKKKENVNVAVVNFGVGDYFAIPDEYLYELFKETDSFFKRLETPRNILTVSTSLLLNADKMEAKIQNMIAFLHPNQFAFDVVIDSSRLDLYYKKYLNNLKVLQKYFPFSDIVINVSGLVKPEDAISVVKFLKENNVLNVDIQYAINKDNKHRVKMDKEVFAKFADIFYKNIQSDMLDLSVAQPTQTDDTTVYSEIEKQAKDILSERVAVDALGNIYPIAFGLGDIILDERYDFSPIGNINGPIDEEKAIKSITDFLKKIFIKTKVCHTCDFKNKCYGTGYAFYNVFQKEKTKCENLGYYYFQKSITSEV